MHTDRAVTRPSSEPVAMRPIVDRQTPVKTLPSLTVGNNAQLSGRMGPGVWIGGFQDKDIEKK